MKKAFLLVVLVVFSAVCLLSLVSCGEKTVYGEVEYQSRVIFLLDEDERNQFNEEETTRASMSMLSLLFTAIRGSTKVTISDIKDVREKVVYTVDDKDVENAVVVGKWEYLFSTMNADSNSNEIDYVVPGMRELWEKAKKEQDSLQKYIADIGAYTIKKESNEYYGKTVLEVMTKEHVSDFEPSRPLVQSVLEENPILQYGDGSLMMATLCHYGVLDFEKEAKGSGKLVVRNGKEDITLNVVGYYETEADKMLEKAVSMDKNSKEYKTVLEQLQNPTFYSVCGNFLE